MEPAVDGEEEVSVIAEGLKDCVIDPNSSSCEDSSFWEKNGLVPLDENTNTGYLIIKNAFLHATSSLGNYNIVGIFKNSQAVEGTNARSLSFGAFSDELARKNGGDANLKGGWYAGSREEILRVMTQGFTGCRHGSHGIGIYLSPTGSLIDHEVRSRIHVENGMGHVLLCRVLLGKPEKVALDSGQSQPSSTEFDSGVDDLADPRKIIIWSPFMNTHILPGYVVSFTATGGEQADWQISGPGSPSWRPSEPLTISRIKDMLVEHLIRSKKGEMDKLHDDYSARRITASEMADGLRRIAGNDIMDEVIEALRQDTESRRGRD